MRSEYDGLNVTTQEDRKGNAKTVPLNGFHFLSSLLKKMIPSSRFINKSE